jgi:hypothetical protein
MTGENMKRQLGALLTTVLLFASLFVSAGDAADHGAVTVVDNYLNALIVGDIEGMKNSLAPGLLQKKAAVLDIPSYDETLRSRYQNATFSIVDSVDLADDRTQIDTQIVFGSGRPMVASFVVVKDAAGDYWIAEEVE